jgi:hypothetical protein
MSTSRANDKNIHEIVEYINRVKSSVEMYLGCTFGNFVMENMKDQNENQRLIYDSLKPIFDELQNCCDSITINRIGFLGIRGAGKTSLINSIAGFDLLPEGRHAPTTACITEVCGWEKNIFHATIFFLSREDWDAEVKRALECVHYSMLNPEEVEDIESKNITTSFNEKIFSLWSSYSKDEIPTAELNLSAEKYLPLTINDLLMKGFESFSCGTAKEMKERLNQYVSKNGNKWPIVSKVYLRGPFKNLVDGKFSLLDIPGNGDGSFAMQKLYEEGLNSSSIVFRLVDTSLVLSAHSIAFELLSNPDIALRFPLENLGIVYSKFSKEDATEFLEGRQVACNLDTCTEAWRSVIEGKIGIYGKTYPDIVRKPQFQIYLCNSKDGADSDSMRNFISNGLSKPSSESLKRSAQQLLQNADNLLAMANACLLSTTEQLNLLAKVVSETSFTRSSVVALLSPDIILPSFHEVFSFNFTTNYCNGLWQGHLKSIFLGSADRGILFAKFLLSDIYVMTDLRIKIESAISRVFVAKLSNHINAYITTMCQRQDIRLQTSLTSLLKRVLAFNFDIVIKQWTGVEGLIIKMYTDLWYSISSNQEFRSIHSSGRGCMLKMNNEVRSWLITHVHSRALLDHVNNIFNDVIIAESNRILVLFDNIPHLASRNFKQYASLIDTANILKYFAPIPNDFIPKFIDEEEQINNDNYNNINNNRSNGVQNALENLLNDANYGPLLANANLNRQYNLRARYRPGSVYILRNPTFLPGIIKIGLTKNPVVTRSRGLYTTGVPSPFEILFTVNCLDIYYVERTVHEILKQTRCNPRREFFTIPLPIAVEIISIVVGWDTEFHK